ncbi:hypothetical protein [Actinoallomurus sp. NPDC052274]|uniref:hypothetical protein n=1 Tax=Actinoallomurus sp. NPDC052274 TaxID=3155420 RepID=UPI0034365FD3
MRKLLAVVCSTGALVGALTPSPATATGITPARAGTAGYCPGGTGVTVVVDYQALGGATEIRCAPGAQASGLAALQNAGFTVTGTQRWGLAFVCRINGKPTSATEPCVDTPPASAYWSYWHASNGGTWTYSNQGASTYVPAQGSFEGWSFSTNAGPDTNPPPRVTPVRPTRVRG